MNGRVESDFPVKVMGKLSTRHLRGTIGTGGSTLKLVTVNGSITLHEAEPGSTEVRVHVAPMQRVRVDRPLPPTPPKKPQQQP